MEGHTSFHENREEWPTQPRSQGAGPPRPSNLRLPAKEASQGPRRLGVGVRDKGSGREHHVPCFPAAVPKRKART